MIDFFLGNWSYLGLIVILILTGAGLPLPEEVPVIAAGVLSSHGQMNPWLAFLACVIGALAGDTVMYWLGRHFGRSILREQSWWAKIIHPEREAQIEQVIKRHGLKVLFSARFLVGIRAPVYVAAGILHLPYRRFILMDLFCATTVVGLFFGVSYWFGETITKWIKEAEYVVTGVVVLVVVAIAIYFWRRHRRKTRERLAEELAMLSLEPSSSSSEELTAETSSNISDKISDPTSDLGWQDSEDLRNPSRIQGVDTPKVSDPLKNSSTNYAAQDRN